MNSSLPEELTVDATHLGVSEPMFLLRLRVFLDWHLNAGRRLAVLPPVDPEALHQLAALRVFDGLPDAIRSRVTVAVDRPLAVVPLTRLSNAREVDVLADDTRQLIEDRLGDIARLGDALHMAVAELCLNSTEHGANDLGAYVVAQRFTEPRRRIVTAVADLGPGIPEHLRQRFPEWDDDAFAIGQALQPGISGTGHPHRGNGLPETLERAATAALHAARLDIHSSRGFLRTEITQGAVRSTPFPAASYRRGTWVRLELISV